MEQDVQLDCVKSVKVDVRLLEDLLCVLILLTYGNAT